MYVVFKWVNSHPETSPVNVCSIDRFSDRAVIIRGALRLRRQDVKTFKTSRDVPDVTKPENETR